MVLHRGDQNKNREREKSKKWWGDCLGKIKKCYCVLIHLHKKFLFAVRNP